MAKLPTPLMPDESQPPEEGPSGSRPTAIRNAVLSGLGRPPSLYRVVVVALWHNYYRVNVLVGPDLATVGIAHSYFVEADEAGRIVTAVPPVARLYP